ncbi:hypothetical protein NEUTE1DRAFT_93326 [Neurospora tetrasperma FGSC 2508]|uniref:ML-like domain-containing protein n=1 Tax=Neurospora tetrasperma (strain FGSC 2508 / ATCC MYA-4615 / P0657) TaxID=510951 RepID=F8N011_NEUT8|nr:uncharacterized protein NEUTE1DRAFT_93326 [Neurospora tetrasperma FGSC 2508]EGO53746.1 hypothetical protein NEUTE1DRAFT_93326 [Neurospora tetrasperma FGSC 2508]EGZ76173.1 TRP-domain-containing protein [Neurospora tetrasperma FGSC 2509]
MIRRKRTALGAFFAGLFMAQGVMGDDILKTVGFNVCEQDAQVSVQRADVTYNNADRTVVFNVAGTSNQVQNVTAHLSVTAYGMNIYDNTFNPCDEGTFVKQLCPVPAGSFSAKGSQVLTSEVASMIPPIAFQIPDIAAMAKFELLSKESGQNVACIQSEVTNGKTAAVPAVSYIAAGVAGAALILTGISAAGAAVAGSSAAAGSAGGAASSAGVGTISPSFTEVFGHFQGMAMNGMLSVSYPPVYRNFAKNFGFSTGIIPWAAMQTSIDDFRSKTGGNLTHNSFTFLRENATLVFPDNTTTTLHENTASSAPVKRAFTEFIRLAAREIETSVNLTDSSAANTTESGNGTTTASDNTDSFRVAVKGIQSYVQQLAIPSANMFMTILLIVAIIIAAIVVGILLVKVVLEIWALFGSFPAKLSGFRRNYWISITRTITSLIMLLYGVWVLYCVFQFTQGDSWAAKLLAGLTLALFSGVLAFFSYKIWSTARELKKREGDVAGLYNDKNIWVRYSLFYESYRKDYWWIFVPTIVYMFSKSVVLAGADGSGMVQTIAQLTIEGLMLCLLIWSRPYERKSGNVINIMIQTVRVLSVVCILVFVEEFGIAQTTQTVTGVVLIAIQSTLTGILAILIVWNAINALCKANPHRQKRKEMEKLQQRDTLTPLDARNSLLLGRAKTADSTSTFSTLDKPYANHDEEKAILASRDSAAPPLPDLGLIPGPNQRTSTATTTAGPGPDVGNKAGSKLGRIQSGYTMSVYSDHSRSTTPFQYDGAAAPPMPQQPQQVQQQSSLGRMGSREQLTASPAPMGISNPPMNPMTRQPTMPNVGAAGTGYRGMPATGQAQGQGPRPARSGSAPGSAPGQQGGGYQMRFQPQRPPRYGAGSQSAGSAVGGYGQQRQRQMSQSSQGQGGYYGQQQQQQQQRQGSQSSQGGYYGQQQQQQGGGPVYRPQY